MQTGRGLLLTTIDHDHTLTTTAHFCEGRWGVVLEFVVRELVVVLELVVRELGVVLEFVVRELVLMMWLQSLRYRRTIEVKIFDSQHM